MRPNQLDEAVGDGALGAAVGVGLDVAEITNMALLVLVVTVTLGVRVKVRTCRGAAVGVVAICVNVHAALGIGIVARDFVGDGRRVVLGLLDKSDDALDVRLAADDTDFG